ncbi:MAG: hypothetical protein IKU82_00670 [Clostridia bacterium]|nr:hypothetical protein [Clostridia bacterium]
MHDDVLVEGVQILRARRIKRTRRLALVLVLSLLVALDVFWILRKPGLTLAGDADCKIVEHIHDETCQNADEPCTLAEHLHTIECYSDETVDVETQTDWQNMFKDYPYTGNLRKDLVGIAKTQVGYSESERNFVVSDDGTRHGYTRYGEWYGVPYSDWSAIFVSYCLNYANADLNEYPANTGALAMAEQWNTLGKYKALGSYKPVSGDLVFFKDNTVGIVAEVQSTSCYVIRGDAENSVQTSIVSFADASIAGWGVVGDTASSKSLYDVSNGPAVFIFAGEYSDTQMQTFSLRNTREIKDLINYLNDNDGSYRLTLLDYNDHPVPKDENGNYIVHADTPYKITITISSPDGFSPGTYRYQFIDGVIIEGGEDKFIINETLEVGDWVVTEDGLVTLNFNQEMNKLSDVTISATVGIIFPKDQEELDFDGKINVTVEKPREEISVTEVRKWGIQGDPDNYDVINKTDKLDPNKIYWTVSIEGNENSTIPGSIVTDQVLKHDWSYEHYYTAEDMARGIKIGVSVNEPGNTTDTWHTWTVYPGDPNLTWDENGWQYEMPETVVCNKNENAPHELVLGNEYWTYYIEYSSTPTEIDLAGELGYANSISFDDIHQEGWAGFTQNDVKAAIYKNGKLVTDANGAKILWEVQATIPKKDPDKNAEHDWVINDQMYLVNSWGNHISQIDTDMLLAKVTANYFGTTINVPHLRDATENDPYAYSTWPGTLAILQRCTCTEEDCGQWDNSCGKWGYEGYDGWHPTSDYCDCWHEIEDTTITITYETDVTELMQKYGGLGYSVFNTSQIANPNNNLDASALVALPGIVKKSDSDPEGTLVKYNITVNESKLNLTDGSPLVIHDEMTDTLAFMRGSLFIKAEDADGNITTLQEDVDYTYTYNGTGKITDENGNDVDVDYHVLDITILNPQPVTYILDYKTMMIMVPGETEPIEYTNTATIYLWGGQVYDSSDERIYPHINIASNAFAVFVHKLSAEDKTPIKGAVFGLFNEQGGLIASGESGEDGKIHFETNVEEGIILREHKIYYLQELRAPPGYKLDDTKYEFTFCNQAGGNCDKFAELNKEHELTRVPFDTVGHIDVTNEPLNYDLPATGGIGVYPLLLVSVIFIITPLVYGFIQRRKRERRGVG